MSDISIVIPINEINETIKDYLGKCVQSIVNQTIKPEKVYITHANTKELNDFFNSWEKPTELDINILVNEDDIRYGGQYLTSSDRMICEENVYEHLIDNKEAKRIREANAHHDNKSHDKIQTEKLALGIALKNFDKKYGKLLTTEQKDCLVKFYTTKDSRDFTQWMRKRIGFILDEIADRKNRIDNDKIRTKIDLVEDKLKHIATEDTLSTKSLKDVLLSLEMKDNLKLF